MKKRILSVFLTFLMVITVLPFSVMSVSASTDTFPTTRAKHYASTAIAAALSAQTNGIQLKIDQIRAVYPGQYGYFTTTGQACAESGHADSTCSSCSLKSIPARGGLPSGAAVNWGAHTCCAFGYYAYYCIYGHNIGTKTTKTSKPVFGDLVHTGTHWFIYLSEDSTNYYVFDANGYNGAKNKVIYNNYYPKNKVTNLTVYHADNYNDIIGPINPPTQYNELTNGSYVLKNNSTGRYLNVDGGVNANKTNVSLGEWNPDHQRFTLQTTTDKYTCKLIPDCASGRLINAWGNNPSSGSNVNLYDDVGDTTQYWKFESVSNGVVVHLAFNPSVVMTASGYDVIVSTYTGDASQIWTLEPCNKYTLTYQANGGSIVSIKQTAYQGHSLKITAIVPTRTNYEFLGWATNENATSATYHSGDSIILAADTTLYAVWKGNTYTVSYNANGGSGAPSSQTKTHGVTLTLSSTKPTRDGYTFLGWSTSSTATSATYSAGGSSTANANTTLYAVWKKNEDTSSKFDVVVSAPASYSASGEFEVLVYIRNIKVNGGLSRVSFTFSYDSNSLTLLNTVNSDNSVDCAKKMPSSWENVSTASAGKINVFYMNMTDSVTVSADDGIILSFKFKAKSTASSDLTFTVSAVEGSDYPNPDVALKGTGSSAKT
ncbi:MAG: InlB B-repeat-containing protein, partial [Clostridiales bacterium]|nr:InlB B-repeat-containing protein [Candidatus Coliplasma equi]